MKIIISPAKKINFEEITDKKIIDLIPSLKCQKYFPKEVETLVRIMQKKDAGELKILMKISQELSYLNAQRFAQWSKKFEKPAIYAFAGAVYQGIDISNLDLRFLPILQKKIRILSGIYGLLRPMDFIKPHRLEMGTPLQNPFGKNLYDFWQEKIAKQLISELGKNEPIVHLASKEYFKSIEKTLKKQAVTIITPTFLDRNKMGQYSTIGIYAKKARGLMSRFIVENNCQTMDDLKEFSIENYVFSQQKDTAGEHRLIFRRS